MATLAANSHNTQPWLFQLDEARIVLSPDVSRRTPVVDPDDHHLYVSLGCAVENLVIAAAAREQKADVSMGEGQMPTVTIDLEHGSTSSTGLYEAIPFRQSTRSRYDGDPISASDLQLLRAAAQHDGVSVSIFTAQQDREAVLELVVAANNAQLTDRAFVAELRNWLRFSSKRAVATGDGLFGPCAGNPAMPEWMGGLLFLRFFTKRGENDRYRDHIRSSSGIAVFVGDRADPKHWIDVGRSFERFALQATALGIRTAHINQPVEVPAVRCEFASWLGLPDARPDLVVRFGRAPAMPMSLRRPVAEVLL